MIRHGGRSRGWNRLKNSGGYVRLLFSKGATKLDYVLISVGTLAAIAAGVPFPLLGVLFGQLVDDLNSSSCNESSQEKDGTLPPGVITKVLLMIAISAANFVAIYTHATCWSLFGERLVGRLRRRYFKSLLRQDMAFFDTLPAGEVPTRLTTDMEIVRTGTSEKVGIFISSLSYFVGAYIVAFLKVPKLAGMLTFMIPAYVLMVMVGGKFIGSLTHRTSAQLASAAALVSQALCNVDLVYSLDASRRLESKLVKSLSEAQRFATKKAGAAAIQFGFMFLVAYAANALAFWQGSKEIARSIEDRSNAITAGSVYTVIFVLLDASFVISQIAPFLQIFSAATGASESLISVSNRQASTDPDSGQMAVSSYSTPSPEIRLERVSFAYPARPQSSVLNDISMTLAPGKLTAIVGMSGSGKSTIAGLLVRLYNPNCGRVLLAGTDTIELPIKDLRRKVGCLDQNPVLFCCSVLENLAFGLSNTPDEILAEYCAGEGLARIASAVRGGGDFQSSLSRETAAASTIYERVSAAAKVADAEDFILSLPHGYATVLGPGVGSLSGGQKQRLALARALVKDPEILVLDEATSSLDSLSEQKILLSLRESRRGRSTVAIAHRLGTIKDADHIVVMSEGRIVEQGTHDELISLDGAYSGMTEAQSLQLANIVSKEPSDVSASTISKSSEKKVSTGRRSSSRMTIRRRFSGSKGQAAPEVERHSSRPHTLSRFFHLIRPRLLLVIVGVAAASIAGATYSGDAVIFGHTIGHLDPCRGAGSVLSTGNLAGLLFFILAIAAFIANGIAGSSFGRVAEDLVFKLRILAFRALFEQEPLWHASDGRTPAMLLSFFTKDTASIAGLSGVVVGTILTIFVNLLASILMTHIIAWRIAIVLLATLPILLGSGFMRLYAIARFQTRHQTLYATSASISLEAVTSIKTIASYSLEDEFYKRYALSLKGPYDACLREFAYTNLWLATAYSVSTLIYSLAYWWGAKQIAEGRYTQTQFFIVLPALLFSAQSCGQMFALAPDVSTAKVAVDRIFGLIGISSQTSTKALHDSLNAATGVGSRRDPEKEVFEFSTQPPKPSSPGTAIELDDVSFSYPNRPQRTALRNVSLHIPSGSFCAFVGPSGSGKSTMVSLLSTLYPSVSGRILFDGVPAVPADRSAIALMPQDSTLFSDTITFNIALGAHHSQEASQTDIEEAARAAGIHDTIVTLPDGYNTYTGPNATSFSGGQKQRLCLARALLRKPRLLLLDEPSSALDAEAETHLQHTLERLRTGERKMTIVVVAHRLCTIKTADKIFWVEDGEVRAVGTHEEMVRGCRGYRESALFQSVG